jgi:hypothetical protein
MSDEVILRSREPMMFSTVPVDSQGATINGLKARWQSSNKQVLFIGLVQSFMDQLARAFTEFTSATTLGMTALINFSFDYKAYSDTGFRSTYQDHEGPDATPNQVRHAVGGLLMGYVAGNGDLPTTYMDSREDWSTASGRADTRLNRVTMPMGEKLAGPGRGSFATGLADWIKAPNSFSQTKTQITEITFEETSNWVDKMGKYVLSRNRSATMVVPDWRSETGQMLAFRGRFYDFDRLATTMERLGFFRLKTRYSREDVYDANTVVVTAVRHGVRKTVVNYADEGPVNLWALQELLRGLVRQVKWERVTAESSSGDLGSPPKGVSLHEGSTRKSSPHVTVFSNAVTINGNTDGDLWDLSGSAPTVSRNRARRCIFGQQLGDSSVQLPLS